MSAGATAAGVSEVVRSGPAADLAADRDALEAAYLGRVTGLPFSLLAI